MTSIEVCFSSNKTRSKDLEVVVEMTTTIDEY